MKEVPFYSKFAGSCYHEWVLLLVDIHILYFFAINIFKANMFQTDLISPQKKKITFCFCYMVRLSKLPWANVKLEFCENYLFPICLYFKCMALLGPLSMWPFGIGCNWKSEIYTKALSPSWFLNSNFCEIAQIFLRLSLSVLRLRFLDSVPQLWISKV